MDYTPLTHFQYRQLLHLKLEGDFIWRDEKTGKKYSYHAWSVMIDALTNNSFLDKFARITPAGLAYLDGIHQQSVDAVDAILAIPKN
jgi:hypothetical protein